MPASSRTPAAKPPSKSARSSPVSCTTPSRKPSTASPSESRPPAKSYPKTPNAPPSRSTTPSASPRRVSPRCALIFELRPESLEKERLGAALEKQAAAIQARHGIQVESAIGEESDAPLDAKESLYRVAQEALHNTVKHARATNVKIKLGRDKGDHTPNL